jgi:hypothetical protein
VSSTPAAPPSSRPGPRAAWSALDHRQRRVAAAAALVLLTLVLPWYSEESVTQRAPGSIVRTGGSLSALAGMSFIEASLLVVLAGVLALLWGRGTGRRFALPYPDGTLVCAAASWMALLIVYRLFARPHGETTAEEVTVVGLSWGIFVSLLAVGVLLAAGLDLRRHGPRNAVPGEPGPVPPERRPDVDPATVVVGPRRNEQPTAEARPTQPADRPTVATRPTPPDDQPTVATRPTHPDDPRGTPDQAERPTTIGPPPPPPPARPTPDAPTHEWPSRMPRPARTPRPQPPDEPR